MVKKSIIKVTGKFADKLTHEGIKVDRMVLYGSYAKNKSRPESDIDVAIISRDFGKDRAATPYAKDGNSGAGED